MRKEFFFFLALSVLNVIFSGIKFFLDIITNVASTEKAANYGFVASKLLFDDVTAFVTRQAPVSAGF